MRFRRLRGLVVVALVAAFAVAPTTSAHADPPIYVALGDSYAAGPFIPVPEPLWGCLKSSNNYAHVIARDLGYDLRDATCSGAETEDMTQPQGVSPDGPNPPQFDSLTADTALVTLQIGGNDIGFGGIAETCARAAFAQQSCESQYHDATHDELRDRIDAMAPNLALVIQGIHDPTRAPNARILVLGYSGIFRIATPDDGTAGCPAMFVSESDAEYLRGVQEYLNATIATTARENGAEYVDVYGPSAGKTACDLPVLRWIEPIVPVNAAAPIHPNINGMLGVAGLIEAVA